MIYYDALGGATLSVLSKFRASEDMSAAGRAGRSHAAFWAGHIQNHGQCVSLVAARRPRRPAAAPPGQRLARGLAAAGGPP